MSKRQTQKNMREKKSNHIGNPWIIQGQHQVHAWFGLTELPLVSTRCFGGVQAFRFADFWCLEQNRTQVVVKTL